MPEEDMNDQQEVDSILGTKLQKQNDIINIVKHKQN